MPSASASAAVAMCTPASSWLTILTVLPTPGSAPSFQTLVEIASSTGCALANAASEPDGHDGHGAGLRAGLAAGDGGIQHQEAGLGDALAERAGGFRGDSGAAQDHRAGLQPRQAALRAEQHVLGLRGGDDEDHDGFKIGGQVGRRDHRSGAGGDELGSRGLADFAAGDRVALLVQVERGSHAHGAETDHADFHAEVPPFIVQRGTRLPGDPRAYSAAIASTIRIVSVTGTPQQA